jgi:succinyl-CoA synthetase alpha subunit
VAGRTSLPKWPGQSPFNCGKEGRARVIKKGIAGFPYYVGVNSLSEIATADDRVCVLNILGGESREVTPVSHAFSGGNVVFGTSPGRRGQVLATRAGDIPVYNNVREGLDDGLTFNTGVVYLPPAGVRDGVAELIRVNLELKKVIMITEKISVHDAREIRAMGQANGIDIFGANCLGVADSWNRVRLGGALGGDNPEEVLLKGSIAVFSNSGGFTTTIAQYLSTEGWGTTTLISSGKDVYIHYAARDFAHALKNDSRTKAAVLYAEPGGYYEQGVDFGKPTVACVVGRWKSKLTRAVGHAGAMAGSGDRAEDKERWFMESFGVQRLFTPENPFISAKGAVVDNIAHIPLALSAVMRLNGENPDFEPRGTLALKPWIVNDQGLKLPSELASSPVRAPAPYDAQIETLGKQIGAVVPRQNMKDKSGATVMDPKTQVTSVHGHAVLDLALEPLEANFALPLVHEIAGKNDRAMLDIAIAAEMNLIGDPALAAAEAAREAGNSPNTVMAAAVAVVGPKRVERTLACTKALIGLFAHSGLRDARDETFDLSGIRFDDNIRRIFIATDAEIEDPRPEAMLMAVRDRGGQSVFLKLLESLSGRPSRDAILAAIATTIAWGPLMRKRISRLTAETLPWYLRLYGVMIGASIPARYHQSGSLRGISRNERFGQWSMADFLFLALTGKKPSAADAQLLQILIGLLISNGPGSITALGAKGAVSADGPQTPSRVQINKAMLGFLTHSGYSHGGNGFEGMAFLLERFRDIDLKDPTDPNHGINLAAMAMKFSDAYKNEKSHIKDTGLGELRALPGVHHPVFKGKPINHDPRERFIAEYMEKHGSYNVFHAFYGELVRALYETGASRYVFCVNVDAIIAALLLAVLWKDYKSGVLSERDLETSAFNVFLYGRMIGAAAEIDDHLNRGKNMDTRTPLDQCGYVV